MIEDFLSENAWPVGVRNLSLKSTKFSANADHQNRK